MMTTTDDFIIRIPLGLWESFDSPTSRGVFEAVFTFTDNGRGECFASQRQISRRSKYSQDTVRKYLDELVKDGHLEVSGSRSVRGGNVTEYRISERWLVTKKLEVNDTAVEVNGGVEVPQAIKQLKKQASKQEVPINRKEVQVKDNTWTKTLYSYQNRITQYRAQNKPVTSPRGLFLTILKSAAVELGDHKYLASITTDSELAAMIENMAKEGLPSDAYYLEAQRKGLT